MMSICIYKYLHGREQYENYGRGYSLHINECTLHTHLLKEEKQEMNISYVRNMKLGIKKEQADVARTESVSFM